MSISEGTPETQAPFGRGLYEESIIKRKSGTAGKRFAFISISLAALFLLLEIAPSTRVQRYTARPVELSANEVKIVGDRVIIPPLVMESNRPSAAPVWTKLQSAPIQILNFAPKDIPPGTEAKAVLLTGASNGLVKARLVESVRENGATFLNAGTVLLGTGHSTEERLFVNFQRAVLRDGKIIPVAAEAFDAGDAILGLRGSRVGDLTLKLAATSGLNFLSGMALGLQTPSYDESGRPRRPSAGDAALGGVSSAAAEQAKSTMEEVKNRQPLIEVPIGTSFIVTFE